MTYESERDEAAENYNINSELRDQLYAKEPTEPYSFIDFKAGANWAQARAEKRAQVLVDALNKIQEFMYDKYGNLMNDSDANTAQVKIARQALADYERGK